MKDSNKTDSLIHQERYTVRIHEINSARLLSIPALLKLMQETSMRHLIALEASSWHLSDQHISWVLLKQRIDLLRPIAHGQAISVVTYPTGFDKFFGYRDYLVFDGEKKLAATSSSMWSLIDTDTRKIVRVPDQLRTLSTPPDIKILPRPDTKLTIPTDMTEAATHRIGHYDVDWNNHVNNAVLAQYLLSALIPDSTTEASVASVILHYKNESRLGDRLTSKRSATKSLSTLMHDETLIAAAQITPKI